MNNTGYSAELQAHSLHYFLVRGLDKAHGADVLGIYDSVGNLRTAYDKAVCELEAEQPKMSVDSGTYEKIMINSFDESTGIRQYDIAPGKLFGSDFADREKSDIIIECVMDSPYMYMWKLDNVVKNIYGHIYDDKLAKELRNDESILVRFVGIEHSYEALGKLGDYWGSFNSCPDWKIMRDKAKEWHEKYDAELIMIAHDALGFQCRRLSEEEAAKIIAEANSLTAEVINCNSEINKNLAGQNKFTLWWD